MKSLEKSTASGSDLGSITQLLERVSGGDESSRGELIGRLCEEFHSRAVIEIRRQPPDPLMQPTALVNELWIRLSRQERVWHDRDHFIAVAATAMRHILIDHSRRRRTERRENLPASFDLDELVNDMEARASDLVEVDEALAELALFDKESAQVVELRFFAGATVTETARVLNVSERSVARRYQFAKSWLKKRVAERG